MLSGKCNIFLRETAQSMKRDDELLTNRSYSIDDIRELCQPIRSVILIGAKTWAVIGK